MGQTHWVLIKDLHTNWRIPQPAAIASPDTLEAILPTGDQKPGSGIVPTTGS